ncbi:hypothetical protein [Paenibacillus sp. PL91]|nr:hypothetical protein [Paenibacillus sp. PL91]MBC9199624.1 hypothetical protein [Paenibacillus sp. PL91]
MGYGNCWKKDKEKDVKVVFVKPGQKVLVIGKKKHHRTCKPCKHFDY